MNWPKSNAEIAVTIGKNITGYLMRPDTGLNAANNV